ncbi:PR domain zinc finger protein 13-like [Ctenocephalides felis]|uniref:PR domain zinc finger protein 13-like n=1 Tax=Ctenocephalides felis TaxID=7515 RepID=UPI000E6E177A|nr:PR domain zinc finger protein 13-like [Ctenocephalides felis]
MFPIIPQKTSAPNLNSVASDLLVQVNLKHMYQKLETSRKDMNETTAGNNIPVGTRSPVWLVEDMKNIQKSNKYVSSLHFHNGYIQPAAPSAHIVWPQNLPIAGDIQSQNVVLDLHRTVDLNFGLTVRSVKDITSGEKIQMWFSEEISALISMPFLTPKNIKDQNRYSCHTCSKEFEYPNPLKLHIALDCERLSIEYIWENIHSALISLCNQNIVPLNLTLKSPLRNSVLSSETEPQNQEANRTSAFVPYFNHTNSFKTSPRLPLYQNQQMQYDRLVSSLPIRNISDINYQTHASQMETIVSNLGKSNKGHLCLYCGKVYSRKYGLKIHIRTHTGFKPLKCKFCSRAFGDPSNLNKHVRLHLQGDSPYKCDLCNKVLVRRRDLQRHHQMVHSQESEMLSNNPM